tara:strand:+ start:470 stop:664 length:195 start_codon:yes stop_codon:yes gene_type:complete
MNRYFQKNGKYFVQYLSKGEELPADADASEKVRQNRRELTQMLITIPISKETYEREIKAQAEDK